MAAGVPCGGSAVRGDFRHYCRMHGAVTRLQRIALPFTAPAICALAVYRYGRWVHCGSRRPRLGLLHKLIYLFLAEAVRHLTKVLIPVWAELGPEVWIASHAPVFVGAKVGASVEIHAGVSLGVGGGRSGRGHPEIGDRCIIGPGASVSGPLRVPPGTIVGPNSSLTRSLSRPGAYLGIPAQPWKGDTLQLAPCLSRGLEP